MLSCIDTDSRTELKQQQGFIWLTDQWWASRVSCRVKVRGQIPMVRVGAAGGGGVLTRCYRLFHAEWWTAAVHSITFQPHWQRLRQLQFFFKIVKHNNGISFWQENSCIHKTYNIMKHFHKTISQHMKPFIKNVGNKQHFTIFWRFTDTRFKLHVLL